MNAKTAPDAAQARPGFSDHVARTMSRLTWAILGTENPDGSVQMAPLMFLFEDGKIAFETPAGTRKAANLRARPRATVLVETEGRMGWVQAQGTAEVVEGDRAAPILHRIKDKYMTTRGMEIYEDVSIDDAAIVVTPTSWSSWSAEQMIPLYEAKGYGLEDMAQQFKEQLQL